MPVPTLRALLALDAATCALMGAGLALAAGPVARLTALPPALLAGAGLALLPIAGFMGWAATRPAPPPWALHLIVAGNLAWAATSLALPLAGWVAPNGLGLGLIMGQAAAVLALALAERRAAGPALAGSGAH